MYRSASALLITLLTLVAFTTAGIVATSFFVSGSRAQVVIRSDNDAEDVAEQGIQEGLLRRKQFGAVSFQYGNLDTSGGGYLLAAYHRSYGGSDCATLTVDSKNDNSTDGCPSYELAMRDAVSLSNDLGNGLPFHTHYTLTPAILQNQSGGKLTLAVRSFTTFSMQDSGAAFSYQLCWKDINSGASTGCDPTKNVLLGFSTGAINARSVSETLDTVTIMPSPLTSVDIKVGPAATGSFAIQKGFQTIDVTGNVSASARKLVLNIYTNQSPAYRLRQSALTYASDGCLINGDPADTSACIP